MTKEKSKEKLSDDLEQLADQLPEVPSFYKFRNAAELMMNHGMFAKPPKQHEGDRQWQIDDLALKLEYCKANNIPAVYANSIYPVNGKFSMEIDLMSWLVSTKAPDAQFITIKSDDQECIVKARRTLIDKNAPWIEFKYTLTMAKAAGLIKPTATQWIQNPSNMINKNAYALAYRGVCRAELSNAYIPEELPDIDPASIPLPPSSSKQKQTPPPNLVKSFDTPASSDDLPIDDDPNLNNPFSCSLASIPVSMGFAEKDKDVPFVMALKWIAEECKSLNIPYLPFVQGNDRFSGLMKCIPAQYSSQDFFTALRFAWQDYGTIMKYPWDKVDQTIIRKMGLFLTQVSQGEWTPTTPAEEDWLKRFKQLNGMI